MKNRFLEIQKNVIKGRTKNAIDQAVKGYRVWDGCKILVELRIRRV